MELVANVWPVVDTRTGVVVRFMMRAYAMDAPDSVLSMTLRSLAPTDFRMATAFRVPDRFSVTSPYGSIRGCVTFDDFHLYQDQLLEPAFREMEKSYARPQGVGVEGEGDEPFGVAIMPRFPKDPYLVVTALSESSDGRLVPHTE